MQDGRAVRTDGRETDDTEADETNAVATESAHAEPSARVSRDAADHRVRST